MAGDRVRTDWDSMRTADPKVFAAGDGAFGPSTIVNAMYHGHRAAYYVKRFLEGVERAAALPHAVQDAPRAGRPGRATGRCSRASTRRSTASAQNPVEFPEIESTYDDETAKREAARCYRCDAETGSADYNVRTREDIFVMARTRPGRRAASSERVFTRRLDRVGNQAHFNPAGAVARRPRVPAGEPVAARHRPLSRRVPGRDAPRLADQVRWQRRFLVAGFDDAPDEVLAAVCAAASRRGTWRTSGVAAAVAGARWLQLVRRRRGRAAAEAAGVIAAGPDGYRPRSRSRAGTGQLSGSRQPPPTSRGRMPFALERELDVLLLEGSPRMADAWPELAGAPDLSVDPRRGAACCAP